MTCPAKRPRLVCKAKMRDLQAIPRPRCQSQRKSPPPPPIIFPPPPPNQTMKTPTLVIIACRCQKKGYSKFFSLLQSQHTACHQSQLVVSKQTQETQLRHYQFHETFFLQCKNRRKPSALSLGHTAQTDTSFFRN